MASDPSDSADPAPPPGIAMLRLIARDDEDLAIISAHMQDAVLKRGDLAFLPRERRFALAARRFDWERPDDPHRRLAGLHFEGVLQVRHLRLPAAADAVMNLLAVTFEPGEAPGGEVTLHFSGDAAIRLVVECVECQLRDLGPVWETARCPAHDLADG